MRGRDDDEREASNERRFTHDGHNLSGLYVVKPT
jgi:hypothetical protein